MRGWNIELLVGDVLEFFLFFIKVIDDVLEGSCFIIRGFYFYEFF